MLHVIFQNCTFTDTWRFRINNIGELKLPSIKIHKRERREKRFLWQTFQIIPCDVFLFIYAFKSATETKFFLSYVFYVVVLLLYVCTHSVTVLHYNHIVTVALPFLFLCTYVYLLWAWIDNTQTQVGDRNDYSPSLFKPKPPAKVALSLQNIVRQTYSLIYMQFRTIIMYKKAYCKVQS